MSEPPAGTARPRRIVVAISSLAAAAALGVLEARLHPLLSLSLFHVAPVAAMAWWVGRGPALLLSLGCAVDWLLFSANFALVSTVPVWNAFVEFGFYAIIALSISALRRALNDERALATTDDVTGAPNRRAFYERAALEMGRLRRGGPPLTLVFLDLDEFKAVNDRFGHRAGDELLRVTATVLAGALRSVDFVARLGGDEFAILLPETSEEAARTVLSKLREELRAAFARGGWTVTSSAGAVTFLSPTETIDSALAEADVLLYAVKANGKNGVVHRAFGSTLRHGVAAPPGPPHTAA